MKSERIEACWQGMIAGLIGYAAVAVFFAIFNLVGGRSPFFTAALFGSAMFYGVTDPAQVRVWAGPVLAMNGFHLLVFLVLGMASSWLAYLADRGPQFWYIGSILFAFVLFHVYGAALLLTSSIRETIPAWTMLFSTLVAGSAMLGYLIAVHPHFRAELREFQTE